MISTKKLSSKQIEELLKTIKARFEENPGRHTGVEWNKVQEKLEANPKKLFSLYLMEESGGEPDVVGFDKESDEYIFYDCAAESPKPRRSVCYDNQALESRKKHKPANSAMSMAAEMGVDLLTEKYHELQKLGEFDIKTSGWLATPHDVRSLGGALFGDRRFGRVFIYHNGADSYYGARGFRGSLRV